MTDKSRQALIDENDTLRQEVKDLRLLLEAATGHSDGVEADLLEKVNATIRESEQRFRLITETIPIPILVARADDGDILYANGPAGALFKQRADHLVNRPVTAFLGPDVYRPLAETLSVRGHVMGREVNLRNDRGDDLWAEVYMEKMAFDQTDCRLVVIHDVTEKRALEKQLRQSQKMEAMGTLAGGIAHDFNNILAGIIGYTELSMTLAGESSRIHDYLSKLLKGCSRARNLIRQILTFSRQTEQEFKPVQVKPILREVIYFMKSSLPSTIAIVKQIESEAWINADPTQIHQVLMNLCTNAGDAMREDGGTLTVSLTDMALDSGFAAVAPGISPGPYIRLQVRDTGCGMPEAVQKRIFDPFFTTKAPGSGTGLGLAMVHGIVKNHGGAIRVDSTPGEGSEFSVYFPQLQPEASMDADPVERAPETGSETILLIDDDPFIAGMMEEQLRTLGYRVSRIMESEAALEEFRSAPDAFDLVISDMTMPTMTGDRLAEAILAIRPGIPVILCSGQSTSIDEAGLFRIGVKAFLPKPFSISDIAAAIRDALK